MAYIKHKKRITEEEIIEDIQRVAKLFKGSQITMDMYLTKGKYSNYIISLEFGNWITAQEAAGFAKKLISEEDILEDMRKVAKQLGGKKLFKRKYGQLGKYDPVTVFRKLGSWNNAIKLAGLTNERRIPEVELLNEMKRVAKKLKTDTFSVAEYSKIGKYTESQFRSSFDSVKSAIQQAGFKPSYRPNEKLLVDDLQRVAKLLKTDTLTKKQFESKSSYSAVQVVKKIGGWKKALEMAGLKKSR